MSTMSGTHDEKMMPVTDFAEQASYKQITEERPYYQFSQYSQLSGGSTITLSNSLQESKFELPTETINLGRSVLRYTVHVGELKDNYNTLFADFRPEIKRMRLVTSSNVVLAEINEFPEFCQTVLKYETKLDEYLTRGNEEFPYRSNTTAITNLKPGGTTGGTAYSEPKYLQIDAKGTGAAAYAGNSAIEVQFPLKNLKQTFFGLDKDVHFASKLVYLEIQWNDKKALGYTADAADGAYDAEIAADCDCTIDNLTLYLALEKNERIAQSVKQTAESGMRILSPYVLYEGQTLTQTGRRNVQLRFSRADGLRLKKIYHTIYHATATGATRYNHSTGNSEQASTSINGVVTTSFNGFKTMWNNVDRQNGYMYQALEGKTADGDVVRKMDDWLIMRELCKGTIVQNYGQFLWDWCFCDDYSNITSVADKDPEDVRIRQGLPLDQLARWDIVFNAASENYTRHYSWAITERELLISKQGIAWL